MTLFSQKPLQVLHVGPDRDARGGIASMLCAMGENAKSFESRGISLRFVSTTRSGDNSVLAKTGTFFWAVCLLLKVIVKAEVDIVHIHTALKGSLIRKALFAWVCYLSKTSYIFHIHNGGFFDRYLAMRGVNRLFVRQVLKKSACVVVLSKYMQELALQTGAISIDQCALIYNGILDPLQGGVPRREQHAGAVKIVFLGLMSAAKGLPTLLDAIETLKPDLTKFSVSVYGNGDILKFEKDLIDRGLNNAVTYGGWIDTEKKDFVLKAADIFVLPSRSEGFSVAILEAMAHGLTIVSTSIPGVVDAVRNNTEAILVPPDNAMALANAIRELVDDRGLRIRLGLAARQRYLFCFTWEKMAGELSTIYHKFSR